MLNRTDTLRDIAVELPSSIPLLEELHLDYCCRGSRALEDACAEAGIDVDVVELRLRDVESSRGVDVAAEPHMASLHALVDHIVDTHHRFARASIAALRPLLVQVLRSHGARHPELEELAGTFAHVAAELEPHQLREESVLFPAIIAIEQGAPPLLPLPLSHPVARMGHDHDAMGELLSKMARLTGHYTPPADACASWRALYGALDAFERDMHMHMHLENNVLFPRALARWRSRG